MVIQTCFVSLHSAPSLNSTSKLNKCLQLQHRVEEVSRKSLFFSHDMLYFWFAVHSLLTSILLRYVIHLYKCLILFPRQMNAITQWEGRCIKQIHTVKLFNAWSYWFVQNILKEIKRIATFIYMLTEIITIKLVVQLSASCSHMQIQDSFIYIKIFWW